MGRCRGARRAAFSLLIIGLGSLVSSMAKADIRVQISYTFVETEVSPRQGIHRTTYANSYTLHGHSVEFASSNGLKGNNHLGIRKTTKTITGDPYRSTMSIRNNDFVVKSEYPSHYIITHIHTNGTDACAATREAVLKQGHQYFEETRISNHEHMLNSDVHFENVTCSIQN